jgi:hypothetical protein
MNIEDIIQACEEFSKQHFRDGESDRANRLAFEVGMLRSKMRELASIINRDTQLINDLKQALEQK